jgi:flagellar basal-body rod protein FlgG
MLRGIYASACALVSHAAQQDLIAGNLANAATVGYKRVEAAASSFPQALQAAFSADAYPTFNPLAGRGPLEGRSEAQLGGQSPTRGLMSLGVTLSSPSLDLSPGPIETTGNSFDLALSGDGFFVVQTPSGVRYTRAGRFQLDSRQRLVTPDGSPVLGQQGEIVVPPGQVQVAEDGLITVEGREVARLRLAAFTDTARLVPEGNGYLAATGPEQPATACRVIQGALEGSNVRPAAELGAMIRGLRLYEANVVAMRTQDQTLGRLISSVQA